MQRHHLGPRTLTYPMPALLVGSYDAEGRANIMTAAWGGICCSTPPCMAVSVRHERWTHKAILERRAFTVNVPSTALVAQTDLAGMVSGAVMDKFAATGLTAVHSTLVDAPYVAQCPLVLECELIQTLDLGSHTQMVGKILDVSALESCMDGDQPDISRVAPLVYDGASRRYYGLGREVAQAYAAGRIYLDDKHGN